MSLLLRYRNGDCERVWKELLQSERPGDDDEVIAVATETVHRAQYNLRIIYDRLRDLGYEFAEPAEAYVETTPDDASNVISEVERKLGTLPTLGRVWYEHIASVNFAQSRRQCSSQSDHLLANLGWYPQTVYLSLSRCLALATQLEQQYREWYDKTYEFMIEHDLLQPHPDDKFPFLPVGGHASNCEHKGFKLPCTASDGPFFDDGEVTYFNSDIRYTILSGGFPRLASPFCKTEPAVTRVKHPDLDRLLSQLTADLVPL